jgi:uncharacterized protein with PQ loop repeat
MGDIPGYAPVAATAFAIPQFLPQIIKVRTSGDAAGLSWPWAALTSVNNAAWFGYFALSGFWNALAPSSCTAVLAGVLGIMLARHEERKRKAAAAITAWAAILVAAFIVAGRSGLGTVLTAAFVIQVAPSIWTAYRTRHPTGISRGTWLLILGELSCWALYGYEKSDPRLMTLGTLGIVASALMLARTFPAQGKWSGGEHRQ